MNSKQLAAVVAAAAALAGMSACSSTSSTASSSTTASTAASSTTTTAAKASSTTASTAAASSTTAASGGGTGAMPTAPSGAQNLQSGSANGATYARYSISGQTPQQVVSGYQTELTGQGYTVQNQGGGGGGWGDWGGANAGLSANKGSSYVNVQAGGQSAGPTYFEVCVGPSAQSVQDCENISEGPQTKSGGS